MEKAIREHILEIGRQALIDWLAKMETQKAERRSLCPHCGQEARYKRHRKGQLHTLLGTIVYQRGYYGCDDCGRGHCPLDQALGLRLNAMSAELERLAGMTGMQIPMMTPRN